MGACETTKHRKLLEYGLKAFVFSLYKVDNNYHISLSKVFSFFQYGQH